MEPDPIVRQPSINDLLKLMTAHSWQWLHEFIERELPKTHRTEQQDMMRFCMTYISHMALQRTDGRNEDAVALAKKIVSAIGVSDQCLRRI